MRRYFPLVFAVIAALIFFRIDTLLAGESVLGVLGVDSDQYLSVAAEMAGIKVPIVAGVSSFVSGWIVRMPGYPALLACFLSLVHFGISVPSALTLANLAFAVGAIAHFRCIFKDSFSTAQSMLIFMAGALMMRPYFFMVMSEWALFCALVSFLALLAAAFDRGSARVYFAAACAASVAIFIRPDYIVLAPIIVAASLMRCPAAMRHHLAVAMGLIPVALLLSFNLQRYGRPALLPVEGYQFILTSIIADQKIDAAEAGECALENSAYVERLGRAPLTTFPFLTVFHAEPLISAGLGNLDLITSALRPIAKNEWLRINDCLLAYSRDIIAARPLRFLLLVLCGCGTLLWCAPIVALFYFFARKISLPRRLHVFFHAALAVHVFHVILVSLVNVMYERYYAPTFSILLIVLAALVASVAKQRLAKVR